METCQTRWVYSAFPSRPLVPSFTGRAAHLRFGTKLLPSPNSSRCGSPGGSPREKTACLTVPFRAAFLTVTRLFTSDTCVVYSALCRMMPQPAKPCQKRPFFYGVQEVAGSNPVGPILFNQRNTLRFSELHNRLRRSRSPPGCRQQVQNWQLVEHAVAHDHSVMDQWHRGAGNQHRHPLPARA